MPRRVQHFLCKKVLSVNALCPRKVRLPKDIILRRVMLRFVGKPLWEYDTPTQFIQALLAIVQGNALSGRNIRTRHS